MMPVFNGVMIAVSSSLAASIVAKATVTMALGLIAVWLARGGCAAVRHVLLAAVFGVMLLLPIAAVVMPPLHVAVPVVAESRAERFPLVMNIAANPDVRTAGAGTRVAPAARHVSKLSLSNLLLAAWAAGAALFLLPVMIGLLQIRSLRRTGLPWRRGQLVVQTLALDAGIHRRVKVLLHEALPGPMTCGVRRPVIVLPRDAENWSLADLNSAIRHELEHVRRGDSVTGCLARIVGAVYWFHPMVWVAWRRLVLEAERSCDDAVLRYSEATAYADQLVRLARRLSAAQKSPLLAMANRADLATRVGAVLNGRQRRGRIGKFSVTLAGIAAVMLVLWLSPLRLIAAPQEARPAFDVASVKPNAGFSHIRNIRPSSGSLMVTNMPVKTLIAWAYSVREFQISGGAGWIDSVGYDIEGKAEGKPNQHQMQLMMQTLLRERFQLALHKATKDLPIYKLSVAKDGFKLRPIKEGDCIVFDPAHPPSSPGLTSSDFCGNLTTGRGTFEGTSATMTDLALSLSQIMGRTVIDGTGITGMFHVRLKFAPEDAVGGQSESPAKGDDDAPLADNLPSIGAAVQEQLGLKLESTRGPVEVLVIDRVEKPSEN
jgi:bla regulator protein blaR1